MQVKGDLLNWKNMVLPVAWHSSRRHSAPPVDRQQFVDGSLELQHGGCLLLLVFKSWTCGLRVSELHLHLADRKHDHSLRQRQGCGTSVWCVVVVVVAAAGI